jgi:hypothetical protein
MKTNAKGTVKEVAIVRACGWLTWRKLTLHTKI